MKKILLITFSFSVLAKPAISPGLYIGVAYGKPFPSGTYLSDLGNYLSTPSKGKTKSSNIVFNATSIAYVPKFKILNGTPIVAGTIAEDFFRAFGRQAWVGNIYNPIITTGLQWLINSELGFANFVSVLPPLNTNYLSIDAWTVAERAAISYFKDNDKFTAHFVYYISGPSLSSTIANYPNSIELDLTFLHSINKLSFGPIAYGSKDVTLPNPWSQFAVGGLLGYQFKNFGVQFWLAKDTYQKQWGNYSTSGFFRVFLALDSENSNAPSSIL